MMKTSFAYQKKRRAAASFSGNPRLASGYPVVERFI